MTRPFLIPIITVDDHFVSTFSVSTYPTHLRDGMALTDQISSVNLRLRQSDAGYRSDWHVAGDPTLIIVQQGTLRITLQNQTYQDYLPGAAFIAQDYLPATVEFDHKVHGHRAEVLGNMSLLAVHIKLQKA